MCFHFCVFKQSGHVMGMSSPLLKKHCPKSGRAKVALAGTAVTHTLPALVQRVHEGYNGVILSLLLQLNMLLTLPEKQASPNTWQLPTVLDWYAVSACAMLTSRDEKTNRNHAPGKTRKILSEKQAPLRTQRLPQNCPSRSTTRSRMTRCCPQKET